MAQYDETDRNDSESLDETLDDILSVLPGEREGWTPELERELGPVEHDEDGNLIIDEDQCYRHVDCENPYCYPAHAVLGTEVAEYEAELEFLRREVVTLHTTLRVVQTIARFPWDFYAPGGDAYFEWSAITNYQQSVVMAWRLGQTTTRTA